MKKSFPFIILFIFFRLIVFSQMPVSDSLLKEINKTTDATQLISLYQKLGDFYLANKLTAADPPIRKALALAKKADNKNAMASAYNTLGTLNEKQGFYDAAILLADSCQKLIEKNAEGELITVNNEVLLGNIARRKAKYEEAMQHFYEAEKIAEKLGDKKHLYTVNTYLGVCNVSIKNYDRAMEHHKKALAAATQLNDIKRIANCNNNMGIIFREKTEWKVADIYFEKALKSILNTNDSSIIARVYGENGNVKTELGQYVIARKYLLKAESIYISRNELNDLSYIYFYLADLEAKEKNLQAGQQWIQKALQLAVRLGSTKQILDSYNSYHYFYMNMKMYDSALVNYKKYKELDEATNNNDVKAKIEELNIQYETQKRETALKNQILKSTYLAIALLLVSFLGFIIYNQSRKKQLKLQIDIQKTLAEEQIKINQAILSAEEQERQRISRDLHDNMGAYTSAIIANVQQLKNKIGENDETQKMQTNAESILNSLRETIWVLNNKEVSLQEFNDGFKNYCFKVLKNFEHIRFKAEENITANPILPATKAIHLNKIMQEAVQNSIKHANAMEINYFISDKQGIEIIIKDNGNGFAINHSATGNGMGNMQWRAKEAGFNLTVTSAPQQGTSITINTL